MRSGLYRRQVQVAIGDARAAGSNAALLRPGATEIELAQAFETLLGGAPQIVLDRSRVLAQGNH